MSIVAQHTTMSILIDSSTVASPTDTNVDSSQLMGQSFEVQNSCNLDNLVIDMKTNGSPSGSFQFEIYAMTGTYGSTSKPTGSVLATSDTVTVGSLTSSYVTYTVYFTGANAISMTAGQRYCLVCNYANTSFPNSIYLKNKTPSFHGGNQSYKSGGTWTELGAYDVVFNLQGLAPSVTVNPSVQTSTFSIPSYTVTAERFVTVTPTVPSATFTIPNPTESGGAGVAGTVQTATFSIPAYTVSANGSITVSANLQTATFSIPAYTVSIVSSVTVAPSLQVCTFTIPAYTVTLITGVTVTPSVQSLTLSIPTYRVIADYWEDKFTQPANAWGDKFTQPANAWGDKFTQPANGWNDKY